MIFEAWYEMDEVCCGNSKNDSSLMNTVSLVGIVVTEDTN